VPVLVSAGGAAAERVVANVNGLVAAPGDISAWRHQLSRVLAEPGLLAQLTAGLQPPKTLAAHTLEIEALYTQLRAGTA
jgi:glycosyltransferase involved in cell wall biosynthesis